MTEHTLVLPEPREDFLVTLRRGAVFHCVEDLGDGCHSVMVAGCPSPVILSEAKDLLFARRMLACVELHVMLKLRQSGRGIRGVNGTPRSISLYSAAQKPLIDSFCFRKIRVIPRQSSSHGPTNGRNLPLWHRLTIR